MLVLTVLRFLLYFVSALLAALLLFVAVSVTPIDRTPYAQQDFYHTMQENLAALDTLPITQPEHGFRVGFAKVNITPSYPTAMAGSGLRRLHFESVHDSIYVRTMVIGNGSVTVALVSLDMLLVPPEVTKRLVALSKDELPAINNTYLSATHTHSSIGNWGKGLSGYLYSGPFDEELVNGLVAKILVSIQQAHDTMIPAEIFTGSIPVTGMLYNRVAREAGTIDSLLRVIEIRREDSTRLLLASFTGHATCDESSSLHLSRDYPGVFVDAVEGERYAFAMFMAGAVGSHGCRGTERGMTMVTNVGERLATTFLTANDSLDSIRDSTIAMLSVPLALGEPQFRISEDWRVRPWLFRTAFGTYEPMLTALRIGDLVMLGTPCDFSGELMRPLDSLASAKGLHAMVTSFNGNYIGYITRDSWYDVDHYETRLMNWYGPGNGAYMSRSLMQMMEAISR